MTFNLQSIKPTKRDAPWRMLLYGPHKIGKTEFGANAPDAVFIPTEDGQDAVNASAFPLCTNWQMVLDCITTLYSEEHGYLTVVLDSADWAEKLAQKKACEDEKKDSIEAFGYGKGFVFAADIFRELLEGLDALREKKAANIIILAHSEIRRFDDPLADSYDRHQVKMHKIIAKLVMEWVDIIGFASLNTLTRSEEVGFNNKKTRAIDTGERVLRLSPSAAYDAGNRYSLPDTLPLNYEAFAAAMKERNNG